MVEESLDIIDTDDSMMDSSNLDDVLVCDSNNKTTKKSTYKKPTRSCLFCNKEQTQLKRHILTKHNKEPDVVSLLTMNSKERIRQIDLLRKEGIRNQNMSILKSGGKNFVRERKLPSGEDKEIPLMCSGCKGFFARKYKARHQLVCPMAGSNLMMPLVSVETSNEEYETYSNEFLSLLNKLQLDDVGNYAKSDKIILMIGARSHSALKKKKDKVVETERLVRA